MRAKLACLVIVILALAIMAIQKSPQPTVAVAPAPPPPAPTGWHLPLTTPGCDSVLALMTVIINYRTGNLEAMRKVSDRHCVRMEPTPVFIDEHDGDFTLVHSRGGSRWWIPNGSVVGD
jgi:hypothetical protein